MLARAATILAWASATLVLVTTAALVGILLWRGAGAFDAAFLFGDTPPLDAMLGRAPVFGGIWPAFCGTLLLIATASLQAIPLGVASGIYLFEYATPRQRAGIGFLVDLLAGVPSVVMGLFGFTIILLLRQTLAPDAHQCLLLAAACLAVLVLPYLIRTTQQALAALPENTRLLGPALGLSRWQNLRLLLLPAAQSGIWSGAALAVGRIAEDTAVIMLTGAVFNTGLPGGPLDRFEALPYRIYWLGAQYRNPGELQQGFGCALALLLLTAAMFGVALLLRRRMERTWAP
jgi:phosphate transport system permease protein